MSFGPVACKHEDKALGLGIGFFGEMFAAFAGPTYTLERALPQAAGPAPLLPSDRATHACPLLPAALAGFCVI